MKKMIPWLMAVVFLGIQVNAQAKSFSLEEKISENVLAFASFPDLAQTCQAFQKTALSQLIQDEEVKTFVKSVIEPFSGQIEGGLKQAERQLGMPPTELLAIFQGEVALAVYDLNPPTAVFSINFGDKRETVDKIISLAQQQIPFEEQVIDGKTIYSVPGQPVFFTIIDDALVAATRPDLLKTLWGDPAEKPLQGSIAYQKAKFKVQKSYTPVFFLYVNVEEFLDRYGWQMPPEAKLLLTDLGVFDIHTLAFADSLHESYVHEALFIGTKGKPKGIVKFLHGKPVSMDIAKELPEKTISLIAFRFDLAAFLSESKQLVSSTPFGKEAMENYDNFSRQFEQISGFSLEKDIAGFLGEEHYLVDYMAPDECMMQYSVIISTLKDPAGYLNWLDALCKLFQWELKETDYKGKKLYYIARVLGQPGTNPFDKIKRLNREGKQQELVATVTSYLGSGTSFYIEGNKLYWAITMQTLKHFLDGRDSGAPSLADSSDFRKMLQYAPTGSSFLWYMDLRCPVEIWWNTLTPIIGMFEGYIRAAGIPYDKALVPCGETISRYMQPTIMNYSTDDEGILLQATW